MSLTASGSTVYEQIELLSKGPVKSRRSKSFSRSELSTTLSSRTGSPHQDLLSGKESIFIPRSRLSSEVSSTTPSMPGVTTTPSRPSLEKARSIKLFKSSLESESQNGSISHKKSESFISEKTLDDGQKSLTEVGNYGRLSKIVRWLTMCTIGEHASTGIRRPDAIFVDDEGVADS